MQISRTSRHSSASSCPPRSGGPETEEIAGRLAAALDAAARLAILDALSDAAGEITRDLAPGSVDVRLRGRDVEFAVTPPSPDDAGRTPRRPRLAPARPGRPTTGEDGDDAATSRTTLRLPDSLKARAEAAAANEGLSLNTWLVRAITAALEPTPAAQRAALVQFSGWVR